MNFQKYTELASRTCKPLDGPAHLEHMQMGVVGEIGELVDALKKHTIYGKPLDNVNVLEECGDALWYIANTAKKFRLTIHVTLTKDRSALTLNRLGLILAKNAGDFTTCTVESEPDALVFWLESMISYLQTVLKRSGYTLADAFERNIAKLAARYGDKYSDYAAINRDTTKERAVLESK